MRRILVSTGNLIGVVLLPCVAIGRAGCYLALPYVGNIVVSVEYRFMDEFPGLPSGGEFTLRPVGLRTGKTSVD